MIIDVKKTDFQCFILLLDVLVLGKGMIKIVFNGPSKLTKTTTKVYSQKCFDNPFLLSWTFTALTDIQMNIFMYFHLEYRVQSG